MILMEVVVVNELNILIMVCFTHSSCINKQIAAFINALIRTLFSIDLIDFFAMILENLFTFLYSDYKPINLI